MNEPVLRTGRDSLAGSRIALRAFLAAVAASAALGILQIIGAMPDTRFIMTAAVVAVACLATFAAALVSDHGRFRRTMHAAVAVGWVGAAAWIAMVWIGRSLGGDAEERIARGAGALTVAAVAMVAGGIVLAPRTATPALVALRWSVVLLLSFWALFGELALASPELAEQVILGSIGQDWFMRAAASSALVMLAGSLAQPVMIRLARNALHGAEGAIRGRRTPIALTCPRCGAACAVEANVDAACAGCGLAIRVEVEEPRCACGYLLHALQGDSCPECGRAIAASARWRPPA